MSTGLSWFILYLNLYQYKPQVTRAMLFSRHSSKKFLNHALTALIHTCILSGVCLISACGGGDNDFSELEVLDSMEQNSLLANAEQAARNENFSQARSYLRQAEQKTGDASAVARVGDLIYEKERAYQAKQQRIAQQEQARRQTAQSSASANNTVSGISVFANVSGLGNATRLTLSGDNGTFNGSGASGSLTKPSYVDSLAG